MFWLCIFLKYVWLLFGLVYFLYIEEKNFYNYYLFNLIFDCYYIIVLFIFYVVF